MKAKAAGVSRTPQKSARKKVSSPESRGKSAIPSGRNRLKEAMTPSKTPNEIQRRKLKSGMHAAEPGNKASPSKDKPKSRSKSNSKEPNPKKLGKMVIESVDRVSLQSAKEAGMNVNSFGSPRHDGGMLTNRSKG